MTALAAAVAWLNRDHAQYVGLYRRYRAQARFLAGEGDAPLLTYPTWGYPWILRVLPAPEWTSIALQVLLMVGVLLVLRAELRRLRLAPGLVDALCIAAFPAWTLASVKLADPWSAALSVLGAVALARALRSGRWRAAAASGVLFGLALHVRSEGLGLLPAAAVASCALAPRLARADAPRWALSIAVAVCLLLPWGCFRVRHGAPFGLTTSNAGMVLYNSLGFQGNAWGIVASDALRKREIQEALGPTAHPASVEGSRFFRARALAAIRERPLEFARKVAHNFAATLTFGFYGIEMEPMLAGDDALRYEVLKEQLKQRAGAKVNPLDVESYRRQGLWDDDFGLRSVSPRLWAIAALPLVNSALSALYLVALLASLAWILACERRRLDEPLVRVSFGFVVAVWSLLCLLQYEPRQANVLHLFGLPLVAIGAQGAWRRWRARGSVREAA